MKPFVIHFPLLVAATLWPISAIGQTPEAGIASGSAPRVARRANRWRYVWHNDHWWYWTANRSWDYFDGRRWRAFDSRRPLSGSLSSGYRKAPAFESPPAAPPRRPFAWSAPAAGVEADFAEPLLLPLPTGKNVGGLDASGRRTAEPLPGIGRARAGASAGGGFGGPTGRSLGAGGAAGGASTPQ